MKAEQVVLTKRLQMLADMITMGNTLVDVGCDHGYLSLYAVQQGISPKALAMDVRKGPLNAAEEHVVSAQLTDYITLRISDGLKEYNIGEAETLVCAGMGGPLMEKILTDSMDKVRTLKELILQPQSEIQQFRAFLRDNGLVIVAEDAVIEADKYYCAMKVVPEAEENEISPLELPDDVQEIYDRYGEHLLKTKHPVLLAFIDSQLESAVQLREHLQTTMSDKAQARLEEVERELQILIQAKEFLDL